MTDEEAFEEVMAAARRHFERIKTPEMIAKQEAVRRRIHERLVRLGIRDE